jgi:hypothetical protein
MLNFSYKLKKKYNNIFVDLLSVKRLFDSKSIANISEYKIICEKYQSLANNLIDISNKLFDDFFFLSESIRSFDLFNVLKIKKNISDNLLCIKKIVEKIILSCEPIKKYNSFLSEIFLVYREILFNLYVFSDRHIDVFYRESISLLIDKCKSSTYKCDIAISSFNNTETIHEIDQLNELSTELLNLISNVYTCIKIYDFFDSILIKFSKQINLNIKSYHDNTSAKITLCITRARNTLMNIKKNIKNKDFYNCEKNFLICQKELSYLMMILEHGNDTI